MALRLELRSELVKAFVPLAMSGSSFSIATVSIAPDPFPSLKQLSSLFAIAAGVSLSMGAFLGYKYLQNFSQNPTLLGIFSANMCNFWGIFACICKGPLAGISSAIFSGGCLALCLEPVRRQEEIQSRASEIEISIVDPLAETRVDPIIEN